MDRLEELSGKIRTVRNSSNRGFAAACNIGAALGDGPLILFLNPDTRIYPGAFSVPAGFMAARDGEQVGVCGIQLVDGHGRAQRRCGRVPSARTFLFQALGLSLLAPRLFPGVELAEFDHCSDRDVAHVMGAFYLVRRSLFEALGGFDERFFLYLEDLDFSKRSGEGGWRTRFLAGARAFHLGGGSSQNVKAARLFYAQRSRIVFSFKHFSAAKAVAVLLATSLVELPLRLVRSLARGAPGEGKDALIAYARLYQQLPAILRTGLSCRK